MMMITKSSPLHFKYLDLPNAIGARGGVLRFFMLANDIPFEEQLFSFANGGWATEKDRIVASNDNPAGTVPMVYAGDAGEEQLHLAQHIATARYVARVHDVNSGDALKDYIQDLVADEYQGWRDLWVKAPFREPKKKRPNTRPSSCPSSWSSLTPCTKSGRPTIPTSA
jgi:hypothetical protein